MLKEFLEKKKAHLKNPAIQDEIKVTITSFISEKFKSLFISNFFTVASIYKHELGEKDEMEQTRILQLLFAFSYSCHVGQSSINRILFGIPVEVSDKAVEKCFMESVMILRPEEPEVKKEIGLSIFDRHVKIIKDINTNLELDHLKMVQEFDDLCSHYFANEPRAALHYASHLFESTLMVYTRLAATLLLRALPDVSTENIVDLFNKLYLKSKVKQMKIVNKQFDTLLVTEDSYLRDPVNDKSYVEESTINKSEIFTRVEDSELSNMFCHEGLARRCATDSTKIISDEIRNSFKNLKNVVNIRFTLARGKISPGRLTVN